MTSKPAFALLFSAFACLSPVSLASPLHTLHDRSPLHNGAAPKHEHLLVRPGDVREDAHFHKAQPLKRDLDEVALETRELARRSDNDSTDTEQTKDSSWLHEHSALEASELDHLLDELGLSYSDVRELVKRAAGGDPVCTSARPSSTPTSTTPPQTQPTGPAAGPAGARNMNVVYYAQTPATGQVPLSNICADPTIDVVVLSFITDFYQKGGYPTLNLASKCWAANAAQVAAGATGLLDCVGDGFATQVASCQKAGKKVLLSVGGAIATNNLPNAAAAVTAAKQIWSLFLGGNDAKLNALRPFGPNIKLDGIDIDNEAPAYATYIPDLVKALRSQFAQDPSKQYYLSAAPQCPRPDQSIPMPQIIPQLDWVFVQFYNNPSCNLNAGSGFLDSLRSWSQDLLAASGGSSSTASPSNSGGSGTPSTSGSGTTSSSGGNVYNIAPPMPPSPPPSGSRSRSRSRRQSLEVRGTTTGGGPKLFIGVLASQGGSGYVDPTGLKSVLDQVKTLNIPNLGGVMYWDGAYQALSGAGGKKSYAQVVRETLV